MVKKATNKKSLFGNLRSHALNSTRRKQKPNFQKAKIDGKTVITSVRESKKNNKTIKEAE